MTVLLDNKLTEELEAISPYYNIPDTSKPYSVSGFLSLQSPANATLSNYLDDKSVLEGTDNICSKLKFV